MRLPLQLCSLQTVNRKPTITLSATQTPQNLCDSTGSVEFLYTATLSPTGAEGTISLTKSGTLPDWVSCDGPTKLTSGEHRPRCCSLLDTLLCTE